MLGRPRHDDLPAVQHVEQHRGGALSVLGQAAVLSQAVGAQAANH